MTIQEINDRKNTLTLEVNSLVAIKKQKYSNVDISEKMSNEEKELNNKISAIYSEINCIIKVKKSIK